MEEIEFQYYNYSMSKNLSHELDPEGVAKEGCYEWVFGKADHLEV